MALSGGQRRHLEGDVREAVAAVLGPLRELDVGAVDLLGDLGGVESSNRRGRILLNDLEGDIRREVIALGSLGLADHDGASRKARISNLVIVELTARHKVVRREAAVSVCVRLERPGTSWPHVGSRKGVIAVIVNGLVVVNRKLGISKCSGTSWQVLLANVGFLAVKLSHQHSNRVVGGLLGAADCARLSHAHGHAVGLGAKVVALAGLGLADVVGACRDVDGVGGAVGTRGEGTHLVLAGGVGVDGVGRARKGVAAVALGEGRVGRCLLEVDVTGDHLLGAVGRHGLADGDGHGVGVGADGKAGARAVLTDVVGAGVEVNRVRPAVGTRGEGRHAGGAAGVGVDAVGGTGQRVVGVAARACGVGGLLVQVQVAQAHDLADEGLVAAVVIDPGGPGVGAGAVGAGDGVVIELLSLDRTRDVRGVRVAATDAEVRVLPVAPVGDAPHRDLGDGAGVLPAVAVERACVPRAAVAVVEDVVQRQPAGVAPADDRALARVVQVEVAAVEGVAVLVSGVVRLHGRVPHAAGVRERAVPRHGDGVGGGCGLCGVGRHRRDGVQHGAQRQDGGHEHGLRAARVKPAHDAPDVLCDFHLRLSFLLPGVAASCMSTRWHRHRGCLPRTHPPETAPRRVSARWRRRCSPSSPQPPRWRARGWPWRGSRRRRWHGG